MAPSADMRAASHGGTRPPWRGRSALPVRRAISIGALPHFVRHCEEPRGPAFGGPDDKLRDEAIQFLLCGFLDCFAEPVIGRRLAPTRWLAMTGSHLTAHPPRSSATPSP